MTTDEAQAVYDEEPETAASEAAEPAPPPVAPPPPIAPPPATPHTGGARFPGKVPITAALLSVAPGLGNIYNGLYSRGIAFFLIQFGLIRIAAGIDAESEEDLALIIPSILFFWLFNIFDAYRQAVLINIGGERLSRKQLRRTEAGGFLLPGIILSVIGAIGAFDRYFDVNIWSLFDHWPILMLVAGVVLVSRSLNARSARPDS